MQLGIKWHQFVWKDEVWRLTGQPKLAAIVQSHHLTLFGHIARMDDNEDAKRILSTGGYLEDAPHHMAEHHTAGSEIPQSHTAWSNGYDPEPVFVEDVVDERRYAIFSCMPETTTTTKDDGGGGDNWSCKMYKALVKLSPSTNQHPAQRPQAGSPSYHPTKCQSTEGKSITFHVFAQPEHICESSNSVLHQWRFGLLWGTGGGLPNLLWALWRQYPTGDHPPGVIIMSQPDRYSDWEEQ